MSSSTGSDSEDVASEDTVPATSYVPSTQYEAWKQEAEKRGTSVSILIAAMVEAGLKEIQLSDDQSLSEIHELRKTLKNARDERDQALRKLHQQQRQEFSTGLGRIKNFIIEEPGLDRSQITNYLAENTALFVDDYLANLETTNFQFRDGCWYPPENVGDDA